VSANALVLSSCAFFFIYLYEKINNNKKHQAREQEKKKERIKVQTKDHIPKQRMHNEEP